jgi:hypothetical protein
MQKSIVVVFILFVSFYQCDAQLIIKGKLMDATGEPLPYANITLKNFGSCSNDNGLFEFKLPNVSSPVSIKISSVGYETKIMKIQPVSPEVDLGLILLNRKVVELDEVTIRAKTTTVEETLLNIYQNLSKNYSSEPFHRELSARVRKFDASNNLLQRTDVFFDEYYARGYTKNIKRMQNLVQGQVAGEGEFRTVDDEELFWIDLFFLRRHDAYSYSYPYTSRKAYSYKIDKNVYEYDGAPAIAINYELIDPSATKDGGWPNATKLFGKMIINEEDYAILKIEETILLKNYDPKAKSEQEKKFNKAIQFKQLISIINFKKYDGFYFLSDSHVERINGYDNQSWAVAKADLVVSAYKRFQNECNPCNIYFSKAKKDSEFWKNQTGFPD